MKPALARRTTILVAMVMAFGFKATANSTAEIRWNELAALVVGQDVTIPLLGGGAVAGEVLSVREDSLMMDVRRTSNAARYPTGQTAIPRSAFAELRLNERHGAGGRILGSVVGALVGMVAGAEIAVRGTDSEGAAVTTFAATSVACTVGGYYAGRSMDRRTRVLHIAPAGDR